MVEDWLEANDMACLNDGRSTHVTRAENPTWTTPDTSIAHISLLDKLSWEVHNDLRSDHQPIIMNFDCDMEEVNSTPRYRWRFARAKWDKFAEAVDRSLPTYYRKLKLNRLEKRFRKAVLKAAKIHIGKKKVDNRSNPFFTKEIRDAIGERNRLKETLASNREEWIEACDKTKEMIREEKTRRWIEYVEGIDATTPSTEIWSTIRNLDGRRKPPSNNEVLEVDGVYYVNDHDKANQFAKTYEGFAKLPVRKEDRQVRKKNRKRMREKPERRDASEQPLEAEELDRVLDEAKMNKAAGDDDIPYELLKNLGAHAKKVLLHMYERVWQGEELPPKWRTAIIRPLLKDGKDPKLTVSFRPISLTSCVGKILEKMIADRLMYTLENRGLLNDNQAGFRQGRCTTDQVLKLVQHATDQIQNAEESSKTIAAFFDYEKAYDKVWRDGLITKMLDMKIPMRFVKYVRHFLSGRKTWVEVNGVRSKEFRLDEGLPQGSSISPLLFLIFINDIDVDLDDAAVASLFADDTAKWVRDRQVPGVDYRQLMQEEVDKILRWAETWKMRVNASKTKVLVLSSASKDTNWDPELTGNGAAIEAVSDYPFLGVTVDGGLRFTKHIDKVVDKCKRRVNVLRCMATKDWGNSIDTQRTIYLQYIRSAMEYAASSWSPWASKTNIERLQKVQNQAMRAIASLTKTCPVDFLHLETNLEPIAFRFKKLDDITWDRYARLPASDSRNQLLREHVPPRLTTRHGWRNETAARMTEQEIVRETATPPMPPWMKMQHVNVDKVKVEKKKAEYSERELNDLAMQKIGEYDCEVTVYTDGSTSTTQERGGAGVYIENSSGEVLCSLDFPAGAYSSSYSAEAVAMLEACRWLENNSPQSCLICTDSLSLVEALEKNDWKDPDEWLKKVKRSMMKMTEMQINVLWIPSHCNIQGNDYADDLANRGTSRPQDATPVTRKSIRALILRRKWTPTHARAVQTYGRRRGPKVEVERAWPRRVRTLYARLRTGHAAELAYYQYLIEAGDEPTCKECKDVDETIEHVLCHCLALDGARARLFEEKVTLSDLVLQPEKCRKLLCKRFPALSINTPTRSPHA